MPLDVFDHDDGVVNNPPDRDGERRERDDVERVAGGLHADEGDEHRDGDRDCHDEGRPHREQEDEDDDHGEAEPEQTLLREAVDRLGDRWRLVSDDHELGVAAELPLESRQVAAHQIRYRHSVAGRRLGHVERDSRLAIDAGVAARRIVDDGDGRNIRDSGDREGSRAEQRKGCDLIGRGDARPGLHSEGLRVLGYRSAGEEGAISGESGLDRLDAEAVGRELCVIRCDGHALGCCTEQADVADAGELLEIRHRERRQLGREGVRVHIARDGELDHRQVAEAEGDHLGGDTGGESRLDAVEGKLNFLLGGGDVGTVRK